MSFPVSEGKHFEVVAGATIPQCLQVAMNVYCPNNYSFIQISLSKKEFSYCNKFCENFDGGFFFFGYFGTFQYVMITSLDCVKNANPKVEHKNRSHASHTNHFLAYWQAYWHYTYKFLGVRRKGECLGVGCRFCPVLSLFTERDTTG